ncbi:helix-turn-helix domain-containing protein [Halobacteriales archaeon Cl-PHB]
MAKYSTGDGGGNSGDSCELCGTSSGDLKQANVAGAELLVCGDCAQHGETTGKPDPEPDSRDGESRKKRAARNTAKMHDAAKGDSSHWESGADYEDDPLPYLVSGYGDRLTDARQDAGLQLPELADELDLEESALLALEQGRAAQAGIPGSVVEAVEDHLDVELSESA